MKTIKSIPLLAAGAFGTLLLAGCGNDLDDAPVNLDTPPIVPPEFANVRAVHASPDAPLVDVFSGDIAIASMQNVDYQSASGLLNLNEGEYTIRVEAETPSGNAEVLSLTATLANDTIYNVVAVGDVADLEALVVTAPKTDVPDGNARVQVLHAAPDAPEVDIYVTAPEADLDAAQPTATLEFKQDAGPLDVAAGDYQIRITLAGTKTVVYDSGTVALPDGANLLISATENVATGDSPVALLVADGTGSSVILDAGAQADVRAVHGISDAPAVDVFAVVEDADDIALFENAPFKGVTDYISVAGGDYVLDVVAAADNSVVAIDNASITLTDGVRYTALANNTLAMADLDLIVDDGRRLATAAQVRIFHASPAAGAVDIYVTDDGMIADVSPTFSGVAYSADAVSETGYVQLAEGDYFVTVTGEGSKEAAIETGMLSLDAGGIYTAFAVNGDTVDMPPQLILADDFVADEPTQ